MKEGGRRRRPERQSFGSSSPVAHSVCRSPQPLLLFWENELRWPATSAAAAAVSGPARPTRMGQLGAWWRPESRPLRSWSPAPSMPVARGEVGAARPGPHPRCWRRRNWPARTIRYWRLGSFGWRRRAAAAPATRSGRRGVCFEFGLASCRAPTRTSASARIRSAAPHPLPWLRIPLRLNGSCGVEDEDATLIFYR